MALHFIFGASGAGKSYFIYKKIIRESMEYPQTQFLILVPEQFTMQTQKELVRMHPRKGIMNMYSVLNVWLFVFWKRQGRPVSRCWKISERVWCCEKWHRIGKRT